MRGIAACAALVALLAATPLRADEIEVRDASLRAVEEGLVLDADFDFQLTPRLAELVDTDPRLGEIAKLVDEAYTLVEEAGWRLREYAEKLVFDPERLEEVDGRLVEIGKLKRKYGDSVDAILAFRAAAAREL